MCRRQYNHRHCRIAGFLFGHRQRNRGMRIDAIFGFAHPRTNFGGTFLLIGTVGSEQPAQP